MPSPSQRLRVVERRRFFGFQIIDERDDLVPLRVLFGRHVVGKRLPVVELGGHDGRGAAAAGAGRRA